MRFRFAALRRLVARPSMRPLLLVLLAVTLPAPALAHQPGEVLGVWHGLWHPLAGSDHLLAMLAVGLWAGLRGGRYTWVLPLAFVTVMLGGMTLAALGVPLPGVEGGIAASVLVLGVCVALYVRLSPIASVAVVAVFALLHGYAHGSGLTPTGGSVAFALGAGVTTAALHAAGVWSVKGVYNWFNSHRVGQWVLRAAGAGVALAGGAMVGATL